MKKIKLNKSQGIMIGVISIFILVSVLQNILVCKMMDIFGVQIWSTAFLIGWMAFLTSDIITEIMGEKVGRKCALLGMIANLSWSILCFFLCKIPGANPEVNNAFTMLFSSAWRIALSSAIAYFVGSTINNVVMDKLHKKDKEKKYYKRAILSTLFGQAVDNYVFYILAFSPIGLSVFEMTWNRLLLLPLIYTATEVVIETIFTPIGKIICDKIKKLQLEEK